MNLIRNTILTLILLTPIIVLATSEMRADDSEEVGVEQTIVEEIIDEVPIDEVSLPLFNYTIDDFKLYSANLVEEKWGEEHINAFHRIIFKESSWRVNTEHYSNGKSSAYGFGGFLNATWATVGCKKTPDQYKQLECTAKYIENRYGNPIKARKFHEINNWY